MRNDRFPCRGKISPQQRINHAPGGSAGLEIAFALSPFYILSFPLIASVGFAQIVMTATANTTIQTVTPNANALRGRAISVYLLVYSGGMPLGNLLAGGLTTLFSAQIAFLIGGILSLVAAIVGWMMRKPRALQHQQPP